MCDENYLFRVCDYMLPRPNRKPNLLNDFRVEELSELPIITVSTGWWSFV